MTSELTIIIIEDEEAHIEAIKRSLLKDGLKANIVSMESISHFKESIINVTPDIVISDLNLPDGTAFDILSDTDTIEFPVLVMTAYGDEAKAVSLIKHGALDYLVKSDFAFANIRQIIERCLREWGHIVEKRRNAEELVIAKERAEMADFAKTQFLANMGHEIRTPLNSVIGFSELLTTTNIDDEQKDYINNIMFSSKILLHKINEILNYSLMDAGIDFEVGDIDLIELLDGVKRIFQSEVDKKGIELIINRTCSEHCLLKNYGANVKHVLINLLSNAVKFTEKGVIKISVNCENDEGGFKKITFIISDTGIGISQKDFEKICIPFNQVDNSLTREYEGVGLGLAVADKILDKMGSHLSFNSTKGVGSVFSFTIRCITEPIKNTNNKDAIKENDENNLVLLTVKPKPVILIVDDLPSNMQLLKIILSKTIPSCTVLEAYSGKEAVSMVISHHPDLIFMDIQMPEMNGYEATREIRNFENNKSGWNIPIIALTASILPQDKVKCINAGMNGYLSKPIERNRIIEVLRKYLCCTDQFL